MRFRTTKRRCSRISRLVESAKTTCNFSLRKDHQHMDCSPCMLKKQHQHMSHHGTPISHAGSSTDVDSAACSDYSPTELEFEVGSAGVGEPLVKRLLEAWTISQHVDKCDSPMIRTHTMWEYGGSDMVVEVLRRR